MSYPGAEMTYQPRHRREDFLSLNLLDRRCHLCASGQHHRCRHPAYARTCDGCMCSLCGRGATS